MIAVYEEQVTLDLREEIGRGQGQKSHHEALTKTLRYICTSGWARAYAGTVEVEDP